MREHDQFGELPLMALNEARGSSHIQTSSKNRPFWISTVKWTPWGLSTENHIILHKTAWNQCKISSKTLPFHLNTVCRIVRHHFHMAAPACWLSNHIVRRKAFFRAQLSHVNHFKLEIVWWKNAERLSESENHFKQLMGNFKLLYIDTPQLYQADVSAVLFDMFVVVEAVSALLSTAGSLSFVCPTADI